MELIDDGYCYFENKQEHCVFKIYPVSTREFLSQFDVETVITIDDLSIQCFHREPEKDIWKTEANFPKEVVINELYNQLDELAKEYEELFILKFKFAIPEFDILCNIDDDTQLEIEGQKDKIETNISNFLRSYFEEDIINEIIDLTVTDPKQYLKYDKSGNILGKFKDYN